MRTTLFPTLIALALATLLLTPDVDRGQPPAPKGPPGGKPPRDEVRELVKQIEEAYKAPFEVDEDIRDELRKQYANPTPEREEKILREARRLYRTTPRHEEAIVRELRLAYRRPSPEQEQRVFDAIRRLGQLPPGTVPVTIQERHAGKLFANFDRDRDGVLTREEAPESLRSMWARWDRNGDGVIDFAEYGNYYQAHLRVVTERVESGEIEIKLPRGAKRPQPPPDKERPAKAGKAPVALPDWFTALDLDRDGQVSLYEWREAGRPSSEFVEMDRDGDFLLTAPELLRFLTARAPQPVEPAAEW